MKGRDEIEAVIASYKELEASLAVEVKVSRQEVDRLVVDALIRRLKGTTHEKAQWALRYILKAYYLTDDELIRYLDKA